MTTSTDLIIVNCSDHQDRLVKGLWNFFSSSHGVDYNVGSVQAHRLILDVFLSTEKLAGAVELVGGGLLDSLLEVLYTGKVTVPRWKLEGLLEVARVSDFKMLVDILETLTAISLPETASMYLDIGSDFDLKKELDTDSVLELNDSESQHSKDGVDLESDNEQLDPNSVLELNDSDRQYEDDVNLEFEDVDSNQYSSEQGYISLSQTLVEESQSNQVSECHSNDGNNIQDVDGDGLDPYQWDLQVKKIKLEPEKEQQSPPPKVKGRGKKSNDVLEMAKKIHKCKICGKVVATTNSLNRHLQTHNCDQPFKCKFCEKSFNQRGNMKRHLRKHTGEKPFECTLCDATFSDGGTLATHARRHTATTVFSCNTCSAAYSRRVDIQRHISSTHSLPITTFSECRDVEWYRCVICAKMFERPEELVDHSKTHWGDTLPFGCRICEASFSTRTALRVHSSSHTDSTNLYPCSFCEKTFSKISHLEVHQRKHTNERPFKCPLCPQSFKQNGHLDVHIRNHRGERPYKCELCPKAFKQNHHLVYHKLMHSGERPFKCDICGRGFAVRNELSKHLFSHTERNYRCSLCSKAFYINSELRKHHKRVHNKGSKLEATDNASGLGSQ